MRNRSIGFVFQSFHLIPQLTVAENVETPLLYAGLPADALAGARAARASTAWGCATARPIGRRSCRAARRSGRPSRARWSLEPRLVLADEPTGQPGHAPPARRSRACSQELHREGRTLVLVTHNEALAAARQPPGAAARRPRCSDDARAVAAGRVARCAWACAACSCTSCARRSPSWASCSAWRAVTAVSAVGEGARREALDADRRPRHRHHHRARARRPRRPAALRRGLRVRDAAAVRAVGPTWSRWRPCARRRARAGGGRTATDAGRGGHDRRLRERGAPARQLRAASSPASTSSDRKRVAVLGASVARRPLPALRSAGGQRVLLGGDWYDVVGVVEGRGARARPRRPHPHAAT